MPDRRGFNPETPERPLDRMNAAREHAVAITNMGEHLERFGLVAADLAKAEVLTRYVERFPTSDTAETIIRDLQSVLYVDVANPIRLQTVIERAYRTLKEELGEAAFAELSRQ